MRGIIKVGHYNVWVITTEALEAYEKAIEIDPDEDIAKNNLETVKKLKR